MPGRYPVTATSARPGSPTTPKGEGLPRSDGYPSRHEGRRHRCHRQPGQCFGRCSVLRRARRGRRRSSVTDGTGRARGVGHLARARPLPRRPRRVVDADAVVHLAWRFQPTRDPEVTWQTNAVGTHRLLDAVTTAGTSAVVCASSIAAYSPATGDEPVDESWPTDGTSAAAYCREKAYVERLLDAFEQRSPAARVVRLRPAFVFQRVAASRAAPDLRRAAGPTLALRPRPAARRPVPGRPPHAGRARGRRREGRSGGGGADLPRSREPGRPGPARCRRGGPAAGSADRLRAVRTRPGRTRRCLPVPARPGAAGAVRRARAAARDGDRPGRGSTWAGSPSTPPRTRWRPFSPGRSSGRGAPCLPSTADTDADACDGAG